MHACEWPDVAFVCVRHGSAGSAKGAAPTATPQPPPLCCATFATTPPSQHHRHGAHRTIAAPAIPPPPPFLDWNQPAPDPVQILKDSLNCSGFAQWRTYIEAQAWFTLDLPDVPDAVNTRSMHLHVGACVPHRQWVAGVIKMPILVQRHGYSECLELRLAGWAVQSGLEAAPAAPGPSSTLSVHDHFLLLHAPVAACRLHRPCRFYTSGAFRGR